jgi:hypothetical protein
MMNIFDSSWFPAGMVQIGADLDELHAAKRTETRWAKLDENVIPRVARHAAKRLIAALRNSQLGGTLIFIPPDQGDEILHTYISMKYVVDGDEYRTKFISLMLAMINHLSFPEASTCEEWDIADVSLRSKNTTIAEIDEEILDLARLIAALASVNGVVVLTKRLELVGFGGEISPDLPNVPVVARACDLEGESRVMEPVASAESRYSAAYRLCNELRNVLAVAVSTDENLRFIRWHAGVVTYWEHAAVAPEPLSCEVPPDCDSPPSPPLQDLGAIG